jgi:hypothetical protein
MPRAPNTETMNGADKKSAESWQILLNLDSIDIAKTREDGVECLARPTRKP